MQDSKSYYEIYCCGTYVYQTEFVVLLRRIINTFNEMLR